MPIQNKLAALSDAVEQVSNLIDENEALISEVRELRERLKDAEKRASLYETAYDSLSARLHRMLLVPGVVEALRAANAGDSNVS